MNCRTFGSFLVVIKRLFSKALHRGLAAMLEWTCRELRAVQRLPEPKTFWMGRHEPGNPTQWHRQGCTHRHIMPWIQTSARLVCCARITPGVEGTLTNCSAQLTEPNTMNRERQVGEELDMNASKEKR